ncbi:MAG: sigma-54 dependent transcriptional regulator [Sumerlaeia bacterium]
MTSAAPVAPAETAADVRRVLVCDDEKNLRQLLTDVLEDDGWQVLTASNGEEALRAHEEAEVPLPVTVLDLSMPGMDGFQVIEQLRKRDVRTAVIIMTAYGTIDAAVKAMRAGATDFVVKPFDNKRIRSAVRRAHESRDLLTRAELSNPVLLPQQPDHIFLGPDNKPLPIIGNDDSLTDIFDIIRRIASLKTSALITGESGTGKELVAQAIHYNGDRRDQPFVAVNCGALPENLLESEFFGHERGAFTGAHALQKGKFELASGGTLFLDEIGEMPLDLQVKFLRVLQDQTFQRVGGDKQIKTDVRIIAATNRDLKKAIEEGSFREDLYYRLNVIPIHLPPLRERQSDIPRLIQHFARRFAAKHRMPEPEFATELIQAASQRPWAGNIRELQNAVEQAIVMQEPAALISPMRAVGMKKSEVPGGAPSSFGPIIGEHQMIVNLGTEDEAVRNLSDVAADAQRGAVIRALKVCGGNKAEAAKQLGVSYKTLFNKIHELAISVSTKVE